MNRHTEKATPESVVWILPDYSAGSVRMVTPSKTTAVSAPAELVPVKVAAVDVAAERVRLMMLPPTTRWAVEALVMLLPLNTTSTEPAAIDLAVSEMVSAVASSLSFTVTEVTSVIPAFSSFTALPVAGFRAVALYLMRRASVVL